jgi:hypothetical protein
MLPSRVRQTGNCTLNCQAVELRLGNWLAGGIVLSSIESPL